MFKGFCQRISFSLQRGFEVQSRAVGGVHSCLHVSQRMGSSLSGLTASPAHCGRAGDQRPRPLSLLQHLRLRGVLRKGPGGAGEGHGGHVHPREDEAQAGQDLHGLPRAAEVGKLRGDGSPATARACPSLCPRAPRVTCPRPAAPSAPVTTCPLCRRPEPDPLSRPHCTWRLPCSVSAPAERNPCVVCTPGSPVPARGLAGGRRGSW